MTYNHGYGNIKSSGGDTGKPLNINRRLELINRYINLKDKYILDGGCGGGDYILELLKYSSNVFGIDYNKDKIEAFKSLNIAPEKVIVGDLNHIDFENNKFNLVILNEVLEHVSNEKRVLKETYRVLKPAGILVLFSPNKLYPFETHGVIIKKTNTLLPIFFPFISYIPLALGSKIFNYNARNYFPWELKHKIIQSGFTVLGQAFIWQTFENISGKMTKKFVAISPILRKISFVLEKIPLIKMFGVSQVIIAKKS